MNGAVNSLITPVVFPNKLFLTDIKSPCFTKGLLFEPFFSITMVFYFLLLMITPWLFFLGWILKSWYVGDNQIDILRFFYRLQNYRLSLSFCAVNEKEAQKIARKFDEKVDFYYSYLEPVTLED